MSFIKSVIFLSIFFLASDAFSHARMMFPTPRSNNAGLKVGPCGGVARTATPLELVAGSKMTIQWEETIQHPGYYLFTFSPANDLGFDDAANLLANIPDLQDNPADLPHKYEAEITVPNTLCDGCTLRMVQMMTENPALPRPYFSCADIKIVAVAGEGWTPPVSPENPQLQIDTDEGSGVAETSSTNAEGSALTSPFPSCALGILGGGGLGNSSGFGGGSGPGSSRGSLGVMAMAAMLLMPLMMLLIYRQREFGLLIVRRKKE